MSDEKARVKWLTEELPSVERGGGHVVDGCEYAIRVDARSLDDCAVIAVDGSVDLVVGTDYVRGSKFLLYEKGFLSRADIGRFLVTANISDLAAVGAAPVGMLVVVRYPSEMLDAEFREVMSGIDEGCRAYDVRLLGGDTGSAERLILSGSAIGLAVRGKSLRRSGAEPGDAIVVAGVIGGAGAAVLAAGADLVSAIDPPVWESRVDWWRLPVAQPNLGRWLSSAGFRMSCQDVSDGLRATVREMGERNALAAVLMRDALPLHGGVEQVARLAGVDAVALGLSASTDFVLCIACAHEHAESVLQGIRSCGYQGAIVGRLEPGDGVWIEQADGSRASAPGVEWKHQAGEIATTILGGLRP